MVICRHTNIGVASDVDTPKSSKSLDNFSVETTMMTWEFSFLVLKILELNRAFNRKTSKSMGNSQQPMELTAKGNSINHHSSPILTYIYMVKLTIIWTYMNTINHSYRNRWTLWTLFTTINHGNSRDPPEIRKQSRCQVAVAISSRSQGCHSSHHTSTDLRLENSRGE